MSAHDCDGLFRVMLGGDNPGTIFVGEITVFPGEIDVDVQQLDESVDIDVSEFDCGRTRTLIASLADEVLLDELAHPSKGA